MPSHAQHTSPTRSPRGNRADPLQRERDHLASSRAALRAMREDVEALDISDVTGELGQRQQILAGADRRADQGAGRPRRHPAVLRPPRLPARARASELAEGADGESFYIGRRHVHDAGGDPMVIDWRAPVSQPFYRASPQRADGRRAAPPVRLHRRRADRVRGRAPDRPDRGRHRPASCSRPRSSGRASARCATSSPPSSPSRTRSSARASRATVCVQGAPGTGKTAVGLHRVAYLLYAHRERLARTGTLVIGPNASFLQYIEQVLPALGELEVKQATVDDLVARTSRCAARTPPARARLKGDARMARGAAAGGAVGHHACRPSRSWWCAAPGAGGCRRTNWRRSSASWLARDIRYGAAHERAAAADRARRAGPDGAGRRGARRPGAGRGGPQPRGEGRRQGVLAAGRPGEAGAAAAVRRRSSSPRCADGLLTAEEQEAVLWDEAGPRAAARRSGRRPTRC